MSGYMSANTVNHTIRRMGSITYAYALVPGSVYPAAISAATRRSLTLLALEREASLEVVAPKEREASFNTRK